MNASEVQAQLTLIAGHPLDALDGSELLAMAAGEFAPSCRLITVNTSRVDLPTLLDRLSTDYFALLPGTLPRTGYLAAAVLALTADPGLSAVAGSEVGSGGRPGRLEMGDALTLRIGRPVVFRRESVAALPPIGAISQPAVLEGVLVIRLMEGSGAGSGLIIDGTGASCSERERQLLLAELIDLVPESYSRHTGAVLLRLRQAQSVMSDRLADADTALASETLSRVTARRAERDRLAAKLRTQHEQLDLYALRGETIRRLDQVIATELQSAPEVSEGRTGQAAEELSLALAEVELMRGSTSWRLTAPLRRAGEIARRLASGPR